MKTFAFILALILGCGLTTGSARADGEDMTLHNHTGHAVLVFMLQNDSPDLDPDEGVQVAAMGDGESAVAHVPNCHFEILLADHEDVWHAEFHEPFFKGYYQEVQRRRAALLELEARRFFEIDTFCGAFGVTHFVFDRSRTLPAVVPERRRLFENTRFLVTSCGPGD